LKEETDALNIPSDQKSIMNEVFSNHGKLSAVDFLHLMSLATHREYKKGEKVVIQGNFKFVE